jgi:AAA+ superfamily predicted ATPase
MLPHPRAARLAPGPGATGRLRLVCLTLLRRAAKSSADQTVEFPLPVEEGREKLLCPYAQKIPLQGDAIDKAVKHTANVSASFIKELTRRSTQFTLERGADTIGRPDIDSAIEELLIRGGELNRNMLGASQSRWDDGGGQGAL